MAEQPISPSGFVVLSRCKRRGVIRKSRQGTCTWCGEGVKPPRRTWCSQACVDRYNLTQPSLLRRKVRDRDKGVCSGCGLDTYRLRRVIQKWQRHRYGGSETRILNLLGWKTGRTTGHYDFWEMDHVIPIAEGGHPFDLRNLRTLCLNCHKQETAALRKRMAGK